jgi:hypothetical protein
MNRRNFLKTTLIAGAVSIFAKATGVMNEALANVVWVAAGKLGYKDVAAEAQVKAGKQCKTCKHYKVDSKGGAGSGICALPAMKNGYVKENGYCNMWLKKA